MTIRNIDKLIGLTSHPLEEHFGLPPKSTEMVTTKRNTVPLEYEPYDEKDKEIEDDYQMVADAALDVADVLKGHIDGGAVEAKFIPRLAEVLGQQLNLALSAIDKKAKLKDNKDKFDFKKTTTSNKSNVTNNNTIIMNRNDMLRLLMGKKEIDDADIIDANLVEDVPDDIDDIDDIDAIQIIKE